MPGSAIATTQPPPLVLEVTGELEMHVTVDCDRAELARLDRWATAAGIKVTHIVLARGRMTSQPMLTCTGVGTLATQHRASRELVAALEAAGFKVVRVKIEAAPWASGVPGDDAAAREQAGAGRYFEHHLKVLLEDESRTIEKLGTLASRHGAHLSWNARRMLAAEAASGAMTARQERFVTQRCHGVGASSAALLLRELLADVRDAGVEILDIEREFVVYDSNTTIDDGWIEEAGDL